ncbi:Bud-site selection protein [Hypoxylon sp. FL1284]|nr:Bud-site selection protein [Hypoxylon sp. FL1284]
MPKRKRNHEPSLEEKLTQWHKELARGMKTAKGFERQRLSKRIREAQTDAAKVARLEREVAVLKSLDLQQAAHAHLCSSLLKVKGVAESPKLPANLVRPVAKPEGLSEEERAALHNVTSALCNRKQIRDVIEAAVMGTCIVLRVPMPEKMKKAKKEKKSGREDKEDQADDRDEVSATPARSGKSRALEDEDEGEDEEQSVPEEEPEPVLLKRKRDKAPEDEGNLDSEEDDGPSDGEAFEGFPDSDAEEKAWARYDGFVVGSSDEDDSDSDGPTEEDEFADSRARPVRKSTADDISISSADSVSADEEEEDPDLSESESSGVSPPPKKAKKAKAGPISAGNSAFLPTLMGGYISGSESEASDLDDGPPRKNRRGQRARQAIWEKKYKDKAKHVQKQQEARDQGWDMKRGAVGDGEEDSNKPWKKGIRNPFDKNHVHPQRQRQMQQGPRRYDGESSHGAADRPKPMAPPKRDDAGALHPSWAAAKKAKEEGQKIAFQGQKVVFD